MTSDSLFFEREVQRCRARGHKVPSVIENPLTTNVLLPLCDWIVDPIHTLGIVPNHVTFVSFVLRVMALALVWFRPDGASWTAAACFFGGYWLDCLDGVLARRHDLETRLGDMLEHINDVTTTLAMAGVMLARHSVHPLWCVAGLFCFFGTVVHMGLIETYNCIVCRQRNETNFLYALTSVSRFFEPHGATAAIFSDDCHRLDFHKRMLARMYWTRQVTDVTLIAVMTACIMYYSA